MISNWILHWGLQPPTACCRLRDSQVRPPAGRGERGTQQLFIREGSAPKSNPLPFIFLSFLRKSYPFRIPSVDKWYLAVQIPCLELCIPFNCWKSLSYKKKEWITKIERFLALKSHKIHLLALLGPFHRPKWQISLPFYMLGLVESHPIHTTDAWKRYPFRTEPPRKAIIGSTLPGVRPLSPDNELIFSRTLHLSFITIWAWKV